MAEYRDGKVVPFPGPSKRAWKAAESSNLLYGWQTWTRPVDIDIRYGLRIIRARAREQAQNNDLIRGYLTDCKTNIIGPKGIKLRSKARLKGGRTDKRASDALEMHWRRWGKRGQCDVTGMLSWRAVESLLVETAAKDGEILLRMVADYDNPYGFAVQVIDPETLDIDHNEELPNGNVVVMGVELNPWRRPVAYWLNEAPVKPYAFGYRDVAVKRIRVPADEIIHAYLQEWVYQTRGVPWIATSLGTMKTEDGYNEAAITAARAAASKMAFYTQTDEPIGEVSGEKTKDGDFVKDAVPGGMEVLPQGYEVQTVDWAWPNADHESFIKPIWRRIATGLGVNYNTWANDYEGVNFSSLRKGSLKERDVWKMLQTWLIESVHEQVYERWLDAVLLNNKLTRQNGVPYDARDRERLGDAVWQPRGWSWVDPEKEEKANAIAVKNRTKSISDIIRDRGEEPEDVWEELADDMARLEALGISPVDLTATEDNSNDDDENGDGDGDQPSKQK